MLAPNPTVQALLTARNLIADETRWCRFIQDDGEGRHCALGALAVAQGKPICLTTDPMARILAQAAWELFQKKWLVDVNNELGHAAVMQMFNRAIELAAAP